MTSRSENETGLVSLGGGCEAVVITMEDRIFNDYLGYAAALEEGMQTRHRLFAVDISDCEYISSNALGIFVYYHRMLKAKGGELVIVPPASASVKKYALLCLGAGIPMANTLDDALALLRVASQVPLSRSSRAQVLVVTPDRGLAGLLGTIVERCGYVVTLASTPEEAISKARSINPEMAIVDVSLPAMDGIGLCKTFKELPETCDMPICVLVDGPDKGVLASTLAAGGDALLAKPIVMADCEVMVRQMLAGKGGAMPESQSQPATTPAANEHPDADAQVHI